MPAASLVCSDSGYKAQAAVTLSHHPGRSLVRHDAAEDCLAGSDGWEGCEVLGRRSSSAQDMQPSLEPALPVAKSTSLGTASVVGNEFVLASPGWEERVVSAMNSAQPTRASAMSEAPAWMHQLDSRKPSTDVRPVSSLERLDTGALRDVFGPGSGSTQQSPARAAQQAQTISAALVAEIEVQNVRYQDSALLCLHAHGDKGCSTWWEHDEGTDIWVLAMQDVKAGERLVLRRQPGVPGEPEIQDSGGMDAARARFRWDPPWRLPRPAVELLRLCRARDPPASRPHSQSCCAGRHTQPLSTHGLPF